MSYFSRLVRRSQLVVAGLPAPAARLPASPTPTAAAADPEEIDLVREAAPARAGAEPTLSRAVASGGPEGGDPALRVGAAPRTGPAPEAVVAIGERSGGSPEPGLDALRHVLEWVAAGPREEPPAGAPATESVVGSPPSATPAPGEGVRPAAADPAATRTVAAPDRADARPETAPPVPTLPRRAPEPRRGGAVEEVVEISIGTISVRVEAPPSPVPAAPPVSRAAPAPERGEHRPAPRLARYYLRP